MRLLLELLWSFADLIGLNALFRYLTRESVCILMYHGVSREQPLAPYWTILEHDRFEEQMVYLERVAKVTPLMAYLSNRTDAFSASRKRVVLTFDDGLKNNFREAAPILRRFGFQATQFVVPQLAREKKRIWADELFLRLIHFADQMIDVSGTPFGTISAETIDERKKRIDTIINTMKTLPDLDRVNLCAAINAAVPIPPPATTDMFALASFEEIRTSPTGDVFRFAPHTSTHPILSRQSLDRQEEEITASWRELRESGLPCDSVFAYPNGRDCDFTEGTIDVLKRAGFEAALTTTDRHASAKDTPYRIPRVNIGQGISRGEFRARVSGFYYFVRDMFR